MNILVTGGAGFIGSHLCEALLKNNHKVVCIDNFITGSKQNIKHLLDNKDFTLIEHDIIQPLTANPKPLTAIRYIFHLASPASPVDYRKYPLETMLANAYGTYNILELAKENKAKSLIASTSEVYGDPQVHPQPETYWGHVNPVGPRSCYDESKRFAEALATTYFKEYRLDIVIVRIFNTFGPKMRAGDGRAIPNFINQALNGEKLTIYGDGSQTRSFCYIDDLVDGLIKAMSSEKTKAEVINLGNSTETSIVEVAKHIKEICRSDSEIKFLPLPQDDPHKRKPDISKAKKLLGWEPKVSLEDGLKKVIEWFKQI